jgi:hypothetical protein
MTCAGNLDRRRASGLFGLEGALEIDTAHLFVALAQIRGSQVVEQGKRQFLIVESLAFFEAGEQQAHGFAVVTDVLMDGGEVDQ